MSLTSLLILALVILILLSALFSSSETAFTSLTGFQIHKFARSKHFVDRKISSLLEHKDQLLATILIGNNIVNISASAITTVLTIELWGEAMVGLAAGGLTLVILIFGEVAPKQIALTHSELIARLTVFPLWILGLVLRPIIVIVSFLGYVLTHIFGRKKSHGVSLEQLLYLVKQGEAHGVVEDYEKEFVHNIFRLSDTPVSQIMTHRKEVFSLSCDLTIAQAIPQMIEEKHTRVLVYGKNTEDIIGVVFLNETYQQHLDGNAHMLVKEIMHKPLFIPATFKVNQVLSLFKKESARMAVALDEYGGLAGVVSQQDILENILGELYIEEAGDEPGIQEIEGGWMLPGDTPVHWLEDAIGEEVAHDKSINTLSGYLCEQLGRLPLSGELISVDEGRFHIHEVRENRVARLSFYPKESEDLPLSKGDKQ